LFQSAFLIIPVVSVCKRILGSCRHFRPSANCKLTFYSCQPSTMDSNVGGKATLDLNARIATEARATLNRYRANKRKLERDKATIRMREYRQRKREQAANSLGDQQAMASTEPSTCPTQTWRSDGKMEASVGRQQRISGLLSKHQQATPVASACWLNTCIDDGNVNTDTYLQTQPWRGNLYCQRVGRGPVQLKLRCDCYFNLSEDDNVQARPCNYNSLALVLPLLKDQRCPGSKRQLEVSSLSLTVCPLQFSVDLYATHFNQEALRRSRVAIKAALSACIV
jgi:hypothetical protein